MSDEGTRRSRMGWIASVFHPERKIAAPTLAGLQAMLTGRRQAAAAMAQPHGAESLVVRLEDIPDLEEVGGIAKVSGDAGHEVGIARVGRTSFVGYKLEEQVLREIEVELDESTGQLRIARAAAYPEPGPS
jgi:hypothetical protein